MVINPIPQITITNPATVCADSFVDITTKSIKSDTTLTYTYWIDANSTIPLSNPNHIITQGIFYIKGVNKGGCSTIKPVSVTFFKLPLLITHAPAAVCYPSTIDLTQQYITQGSDANLTFTYYTDAAATLQLTTPDKVTSTGTYYVKAVNTNGCQIIKPVIVTINPLPDLKITDPQYVCLLDKVDITAAAVTAGSTNIASLSYWKDAQGTLTLPTPNAVADSGVYYIKAISADGCEIIKPVNVTVHNPPVIKITDPKKIYQPNTVDLTAAAITSGSTPKITYSFWENEAASISVTTPKAVKLSGTYYIKGTNQYGCFTIKPVVVVVAEIPDIKVPTAFTPTRAFNNKLYPFLIGIKKFTMFRIYNKWGNLVYQTTDPSIDKGWDGSFRGTTSFMETFTWSADGYDYVDNLVHKTGNTLLLK